MQGLGKEWSARQEEAEGQSDRAGLGVGDIKQGG